MLVDVKDTSNDSDVKIVELSGGASVEPQSGLRALDGTRETCQGEGRNSQRFEEIHQCNCGHKGPIASHLRTNQQCVQGIRDELSLGAEMSDESLIVQATLVLQGCPAIRCAGGNHDEVPGVCISWWEETGWNVMQWEEHGENLTSTVIKQKCREFVKELIQKQNDDGRQQMSRIASNDNKNAADPIQRKENMQETTMAELDDIFSPPITSTQVHTRNGRHQEGERPAANVSSIPWDLLIE